MCGVPITVGGMGQSPDSLLLLLIHCVRKTSFGLRMAEV